MTVLLVVLIAAAAIWLVGFGFGLLFSRGDLAGAASAATGVTGVLLVIGGVVVGAMWLIYLVVSA